MAEQRRDYVPPLETSEAPVILETDTGMVSISPDSFMIFIDETGHELFRDRKYPIFGLGGCGVRADYYHRLIDAPWRYMKGRWFGGPEQDLHASRLSKPNVEQLAALEHFFTRFMFCRFAAVLHVDTKLNGHHAYELAAALLQERISHVLRWQGVNSLVFIHEASQRTDALAERYFGDLYFEVARPEDEGRRVQVPHLRAFAPKGTLSGLEVADFVMHAAGNAVRQWRQTKARPTRKDFELVFHGVDARLTSFCQLQSVRAAKQPGSG